MLDVFGAGFGRTGTLSLKTALEKLGFGPCHHMLNMLEQPEQIPFWNAAAAGETMDWSQVYAGHRSSVDWPGARFWREITAAFPAAKVILTVRDPEKWYESASSTIYASTQQPPTTDSPPVFEQVLDMSQRVVWDGVFGGRFADRDHALRVFVKHNEAVRGEIDGDRLLVYEVSQGWEPLCAFLGVPVPDEPFPRSNDRANFASRVEAYTTQGRS